VTVIGISFPTLTVFIKDGLVFFLSCTSDDYPEGTVVVPSLFFFLPLSREYLCALGAFCRLSGAMAWKQDVSVF